MITRSLSGTVDSLLHFSKWFVSGKTENKRWFQAKRYLRGETGAGGLVTRLPCTAYFGKFKIASYSYCLAVPSPLVLVETNPL